MKRLGTTGEVDMSHPNICFHREVLSSMQWAAIRREFLSTLQAAPKLRFTEPKKLWRHSQEALGKWILSQAAREGHREPHCSKRGNSEALPVISCRAVHPFPSGPLLAAGTYDEQLVRDISLKCEDRSNPDTLSCINKLVKDFNLAKRCERAAAEVRRELETVTPSSYCLPLLEIISAEDMQSRTLAQKRVEGAVAVFRVKWPRSIARDRHRDCPPVFIPLAAYNKLGMCYKHFSDADERLRYPKLAYEERLTLRAATLALRYEGILATGSLQLCADTELKQYLHASGYHVMDLCASPINAYMGSIPTASHSTSASTASATNLSFLDKDDTPNHFCSAFPDTDTYFGSLGSVLEFNPEMVYSSSTIVTDGKPLLLTLDVPYDEDLCEQMFLKLVADMERLQTEIKAGEQGSNARPRAVDYVLVLPLWWDVPMMCEKQLFVSSSDELSRATPEERKAALDSILQKRNSVLREGHTIPYEWPHRLAAAARQEWVCFDGVFVGGAYEYFCTSTNKCLRDVTATEVIGLAQPRERQVSSDKGEDKHDPSLKELLSCFYKNKHYVHDESEAEAMNGK
ncbi:Phosphorylated CTD interacting factor 1 WW domain [Trypanosoma vivax]|nr:hypothetical protein TRVL_00960 [Trypanosoma vivax]KAH8616957.1 Phosphorylated CTD interacting factor 1 WW domain [Trypanosoma vivax]